MWHMKLSHFFPFNLEFGIFHFELNRDDFLNLIKKKAFVFKIDKRILLNIFRKTNKQIKFIFQWIIKIGSR